MNTQIHAPHTSPRADLEPLDIAGHLPASMIIDQGRLACLHAARGVTLRVQRGCLWITEEGSTVDVCVRAGEAYTIANDGSTVLGALRRSPGAAVTLACSLQPVPLRAGLLFWPWPLRAPLSRLTTAPSH